MEGRKSELENQLNNNLIRRRNELAQAMEEISLENKNQILETHQADLRSVSKTIKKARERMKGIVN